MATYSHSRRLFKAYETCHGYYGGFGPVGVKPRRLKVQAGIIRGKFSVMLIVMPHRRR
jgi:hypothetical protein